MTPIIWKMLKKNFKIDNNFYSSDIIKKGLSEFLTHFQIWFDNWELVIQSEDDPEVIYDELNKRATGVKIIDSESNLTYEFKAKIIFMCASTVPTTSILMQSKSNRFPNGLGNDSGELGHNIMDHHFHGNKMTFAHYLLMKLQCFLNLNY